MFDKEIAKIAEYVNTYNSFLITATADPDGDSIGAQLALKSILNAQFNKKDKIIKIINEGVCPEKYRFLAGSDEVLSVKNLMEDSYDVGFVLDGGSERTGNVKSLFDRCKIKILIDHHKFGSKETYDIKLHSPTISSTAEIVYQFIKSNVWKVELNKDIAAQLYLGLIFDTGCFRHSNTSPQTLEAASTLIKTGFDFSMVADRGMLQKELKAQKLLAKVLDAAEANNDGKIIWSMVSNKMLSETGCSQEEQDGLIDQLIIVSGVEVAILFKEDENKAFKISFRSKGLIDVGKFARSLDNDGGGHERASGCKLEGQYENIVEEVIGKLESSINTLSS